MGEHSGGRRRLVRYMGAAAAFLLVASVAAWAGVVFAKGDGGSEMQDSAPADQGEHRYGQPYVPSEIELAGERVPLECVDVRESLEWEMCVISNWHSQVLLILKRAPRYFAVIEPILRAHGVPDDFKYLAVVESNLYDRAYSPSNAAGVWQFLEETAREQGLEVNEDVDERYNLRLSTHAACMYLKESYGRFGSWAMAAAAYNMGRTALQRQVDRQGEQSFYNLLVGVETGRYVFRIIAFKIILENPERYGFHLDASERFPILATRQVEVDTTVDNLSEFAKAQGANYKTLKWLNPWLRTNTLPVVGDKKYTLEIVDSTARRRSGKS